MSMTYYAVTDDPNELVHWGVKGMKWGVRHDKPRHSGSRSNRPRSIAYKKAQSKLSKMMKSGIKKAEAHWKEYNSPKAKEERFMKKAMQQARTGTLKYGKLTDAQVRRVTDRLALERNARQLGGTENPRYTKRLKMAVGEGIIRGIGMGTASYIDERFKGRGRTTAEIKADKRKAKYEGRDDVQRRRARNKQTEEFYKTAYEEGDNPYYYKLSSNRARAKYLSNIKERNKASEVKKQQRESFDRAYYSNMGKNAADWTKSKVDGKSTSDWSNQKSYPRLMSGSSGSSTSKNYAVTRNTYKAPESNTVIYVDPKGTARQKQRTGRKKNKVYYD